MTDDIRYAAIRDFLRENAGDVELRLENEAVDPPAEALWVHLEFEGQSVRQASIGSGAPSREFWRETGVVVLLIHAPLNSGSLAARALAKRLGRLFRGREIAGMRFEGPSVNAGEPSQRRSAWWVLPLVIPYEYDDLEV
jgi:hypothetical protein